jgi:hypothetical protein
MILHVDRIHHCQHLGFLCFFKLQNIIFIFFKKSYMQLGLQKSALHIVGLSMMICWALDRAVEQ